MVGPCDHEGRPISASRDASWARRWSTETFNAFYFTPAIAKNGVSISTIFSTHPSLDQRLAQLASLEAEMGRPS